MLLRCSFDMCVLAKIIAAPQKNRIVCFVFVEILFLSLAFGCKVNCSIFFGACNGSWPVREAVGTGDQSPLLVRNKGGLLEALPEAAACAIQWGFLCQLAQWVLYPRSFLFHNLYWWPYPMRKSLSNPDVRSSGVLARCNTHPPHHHPQHDVAPPQHQHPPPHPP